MPVPATPEPVVEEPKKLPEAVVVRHLVVDKDELLELPCKLGMFCRLSPLLSKHWMLPFQL